MDSTQNGKKTALVTGGAGFIGSHLVERLLNRGYRVICVDSFFSGKKENIAHLLNNPDFELIKHNIIFPIKRRFERIDEIYNLACPASPVQYQFDPVLTLKTSVLGTMNMLDLARKYGSRVLYTSTSEVYGDPLEHPQKETYFGNVDSLGKRACYDEGKRAAEALCKDYHAQYGVDVRIVRLFNIYGPRMMFNDGRVISNFIMQALLGEEITVHGDGSQTRSFMYIDDLIDAFEKAMALSEDKIGIGPLNLGNPDERSIKSLAEAVRDMSGSKSTVSYVPYDKIPERLGDPQRRCPDISKTSSMIDWRPKTSFEDGLKKSVEDFRERLKNKTRVIIFIPAFLPMEGPVENAIKQIAARMPGYEFHVMTSRHRKDLAPQEDRDGFKIFRIGSGSGWDKYFLMILAPFKALSLHKKNNYQAAWGIMASYGSLAGVIFSYLTRVALMVSVFEGKIKDERNGHRRFFRPIYKIIFRRANRLQIVGDLTDEQLAWLEDEKRLRAVDMAKGWDFVAKKTKEQFQELEIITSRL